MTENDFAAPRAGRLRYWNYVAVYGLLAAIVLYPIAVVNIPGLEDYPNHLARMYILSHFKSSPDLQRFYQVRWQPIPYVGMDAAFLLLNRIAPVYDAGRILIGFCVLLPVRSRCNASLFDFTGASVSFRRPRSFSAIMRCYAGVFSVDLFHPLSGRDGVRRLDRHNELLSARAGRLYSRFLRRLYILVIWLLSPPTACWFFVSNCLAPRKPAFKSGAQH